MPIADASRTRDTPLADAKLEECDWLKRRITQPEGSRVRDDERAISRIFSVFHAGRNLGPSNFPLTPRRHVHVNITR
jgi:hypothetical protein